MNNLKRILSLALASVMVMGMMVVGASAANFDDNDAIDHNAAVDVMAALDIIKGYAEDNTFRPGGDVTRAQMAKMLTVVMYGYEPSLGKPTTATFADSASHWAVEFIEYCYNNKIIAGKSTTEFDPEGKVTAAEAAKMILVALGFNPDVFGLVGSTWLDNTMTLATNLPVAEGTGAQAIKDAKTLNLFDGLTGIGPNTPLTRDQAAQLIYNGIQAPTVKMALTGVTAGTNTGILGGASGQVPTYSWTLSGDPLLKSNFHADVVVGTLDEVEYTAPTTDTPAFWAYTLDNVVGDNDPGEFNPTEINASDLFKQTVRVVVTEDSDILAITAVGNDVASSNVIGGLKTTTVTNEDDTKTVTRLDSTKVAGGDASALDVYSLETLDKMDGADITDWDGNIYDEYKLITDENGEIACVVVTPVTLTTVKSVATKGITLTKLSAQGQDIAVTFEGNDVEAGLAKGDYVTMTKDITGAMTVKAAETMTAKVDASRTSASGVTTLRVGGKWYTVAATEKGGKLSTPADLNGYNCDLVLVAGYIVAGAPVEPPVELSDAVMVVKVAGESTKVSATVDVAAKNFVQIRVLKGDGTTAVLNVSGTYTPATESEAAAIVRIDQPLEDSSEFVNPGEVYTYREDPASEGYYLLTKYEGDAVYTDKMIKSDENGIISISRGIAAQGDDEEKVTYRFAADATIFVMAGNDPSKYAVLTGAEVAAWGATTYKTGESDTDSALYATRSANGFTYIQLGFLTLDGRSTIPGRGGSISTGYGIVTENAIRVLEDDGKYYLYLNIWNGEEEIEVMYTEESTQPDDTKNYLAGTVVTYTDNNNGAISGLTNLADKRDAVVAWDGVDTLKFAVAGDGEEYTITDSTKIRYVDLENDTGATGEITLATPKNEEDLNEGYYANVWVEVGDENTVEYIIVEVNNDAGKVVGATEGGNPDPDPEEECEHESISEVPADDTYCKHYKCDNDECGQLFSDEEGTTEIDAAPEHEVASWSECTDSSDTDHNGTHHSGSCTKNGCGETVWAEHTFGDSPSNGDTCSATGCNATYSE